MMEGNGIAEPNKEFHTFKLEKEEKKQKPVNMKTIILMQLFILGVFIVGFIIGLCVGIFAYNGENGVSSSSNKEQQKDGAQAEVGESSTRSTLSSSSSFPSNKKTTKVPAPNEFINMPNSIPSIDSPITSSPPVSSHASYTTDVPSTTTPDLRPTKPGPKTTTPEPETKCKICKKRKVTSHGKKKQELYAPLTREEMELVNELLTEKEIMNNTNATSLRKDFMHALHLTPPNKSLALAYLDSKGPFPGRYATAFINHGSTEPPTYMEYNVGPMDGPRENITIVPMLDPDEVPYYKRPYDIFEIEKIMMFIFKEISSMGRLIRESFDIINPMDDLNIIPIGPFESEEGNRISRFSLTLRGLGNRDLDFLSALPLTARINHESLNTSDWYIYDYYYLSQGPFPNSSYLYSAYHYNMITKVQFPMGSKESIQEMAFPQRDEFLPPRQNSFFAGPKTYEPTGPRFEISGHDISWLGWSFSATTSTLRGPSIFNVRFKNERILYENSLNDIALVYSADDPGKDNVVYNDAEYGIGNARKPIMGVDCPEHAALLNISVWQVKEGAASVSPAICVFEKDNQEPLWRHNGIGFRVGIRNRILVVRYPTRIGNYDYIFDYEFHLDGKMKTIAIATGFLFGSFYDPYTMNYGGPDGRTPFGYKIGSFLTGPIHDHTFGFKVDLDIVGTKNNFELIHWKQGSLDEAVNSYRPVNTTPSYFLYNTTRYLQWETITTEKGLNINLQNQTFWTVINNQAKSPWNVSRGYRIVPMATSTQNLGDDYPMMGNIAFTKHQCHITRRREEEQFMKPTYKYNNKNNTKNIKRYLQDMIDGESVDNEDLVTWLSVGFLHIPTSEDTPITSRVESGFVLKPFNFFETLTTYDLPQYTEVINRVFDKEPTAGPCLIKS